MLATIVLGLFWGVVALVAAISVLPFSKIPHGAIRGMAFPREQLFVLTVALAAVAAVFGLGFRRRLEVVQNLPGAVHH